MDKCIIQQIKLPPLFGRQSSCSRLFHHSCLRAVSSALFMKNSFLIGHRLTPTAATSLPHEPDRASFNTTTLNSLKTSNVRRPSAEILYGSHLAVDLFDLGPLFRRSTILTNPNPNPNATARPNPIPGVSNSFGGGGHTARYHSVGGPHCS